MKDASTPLRLIPSPNWQLLGELELRANTNFDYAVGKWLAMLLRPFHLHVDFVNKVVKSAEEAAARAMHSETVKTSQHTHLVIYVPAERSANGRSWGFFRIDKVGTGTENGNPDDHSIEFYLYLEGQ